MQRLDLAALLAPPANRPDVANAVQPSAAAAGTAAAPATNYYARPFISPSNPATAKHRGESKAFYYEADADEKASTVINVCMTLSSTDGWPHRCRMQMHAPLVGYSQYHLG